MVGGGACDEVAWYRDSAVLFVSSCVYGGVTVDRVGLRAVGSGDLARADGGHWLQGADANGSSPDPHVSTIREDTVICSEPP